MKLYLVRGNDVDGENQDWFVIAETPGRAIEIWNDHLIENAFPRDDGDDEDTLPRKRTVDPANSRRRSAIWTAFRSRARSPTPSASSRGSVARRGRMTPRAGSHESIGPWR